MPARVLDLYIEFRNSLNGLKPPTGFGLLGALSSFGLPQMSVVHKDRMRDLVLRGGPWSAEERLNILDYCQEDVEALELLLPKLMPYIRFPQALLRGRYMKAVACMEWNGVPIDVNTFNLLQEMWPRIKNRLISQIDEYFDVYTGATFSQSRFIAYLAREGIAWPQLGSGGLDLSDKAFKDLAKTYPKLAPLRELRSALSQLRLTDLQVGSDGRNRVMLSPFSSRSSRNQPSNRKFIFGPSVWLRGLIKPEPGRALAYIDWSAQEHGIAAALSGDAAMIEAYRSGDPYLAFAKQAGAVPPDGTKATHARERNLYKTVVLGVGYGMEFQSLAIRAGISAIEARELLLKHRETYPRFWGWADNEVDRAMLLGSTHTLFGWQIRTAVDQNPRSLRNFPMQANGAEMLRIACCLGTERGIKICAPVHDAVLIEAPENQIEETVQAMQSTMVEASRIVLGGFELRTDAEIVRYPDRYRDPRGTVMWDKTMKLVAEEGAQCRKLSS
jgi:DNA polymerase I